jgi:hypothetical protein
MAGDKLFYYQTLALYGIIDAVIIYLTLSVVGADNRSTMYTLFIFLLAYSIFGLYLFIGELGSNYNLSTNTIQFTNTSGGNVQTLTSWGLILVNVIGIGVYGYSIATGSSAVKNAEIMGGPFVPSPTNKILVPRPRTGQAGGRR